MRKIVLFSVLIVLLFSLGCKAKQPSALRIGMSDDNAPFCSEVDGSLVGIDSDIAHNIIRILEIPYEISAMPQDQIEEKLLSGGLDLGFVYIAHTEDLNPDINYSMPYYEGTRGEEESEIYRYMLAMPKDAKMNDDIMAALEDLIQNGDLLSILQTHIY